MPIAQLWPDDVVRRPARRPREVSARPGTQARPVTADTAATGTESQLIRRGVAWTMTAGLVTHVFRILIALVLARLLSPHEYGLAGMALVVAGFVLAFSDLALG